MDSVVIRLILAAACLGSAAGSIIETLADGETVPVQEHEATVHQHEASDVLDDAWYEFVKKHKRDYHHGTKEYSMRQGLFKKRLAAVHAHNAKTHRRWKAGPSKFSDRTEHERKAVRGYVKGARRAARGGSSLLQEQDRTSAVTLPESKDWMHLNCAHKVRDQGGCGSCWAITTSSVLEAHYEIWATAGGNTTAAYAGGTSRTFSAQQTLECTPNPHECGGSGGCQGATVELGMAYILANGIATEHEVPYKGQDGSCTAGLDDAPSDSDSSSDQQSDPDFQDLSRMRPAEHGGGAFGMVNYHTLESNRDQPLAEAVALYGPVAISAAAEPWFEYSAGVFDGCEKDAIVDHAITLFGYGVENGVKYWKIRNSWGKDWGEDGFIRVLRIPDNGGEKQHCGTDNDPSQGVACKPFPEKVEICGMCGVLYDSVVPYFRGSPGHTGSTDGSLTELVSIDADANPKIIRAERH
jgi:cathepsin L